MFKVNWKLVFEFYLTIAIPLLYLFNIALAFKSVEVTPLSVLKILGVLVALFGLVFWLISFFHLGNSFGVLPQKQKKVKRGIYKYFNHPMYIGISATIIGISIANNSFMGLIFYCLITLPVLIIRARLEEKNLTN